MKYYDEDTVYELMSVAEESATAYEFGVHKSVDIKDYPSIELGWHTGTPTEEGWYLIAFNYEFEEGVRYTTDYFKDGKWAFPMVRDISKLKAWQKIEPYKEASE